MLKYSHLALHLSLQVLDDFLLLEESLLELISPLGLLGWSPGNLAKSSFKEADLQGGKTCQAGVHCTSIYLNTFLAVAEVWDNKTQIN